MSRALFDECTCYDGPATHTCGQCGGACRHLWTYAEGTTAGECCYAHTHVAPREAALVDASGARLVPVRP